MSTLVTTAASDHQPPLADDGYSCGLDCAFAHALRSDPFAEEWIWCAHPAKATRVVHPGRGCPRYAPADSLVRPE